MARGGRGHPIGTAALIAALLAPAMAFAAAVIVRVAPDQATFARDVLVGDPGRYAAWFGLGLALLALAFALGDLRRRGGAALISLLIAGASTALYFTHDQALVPGSPSDVSTSPAEPPQGLEGVGATSGACPGLTPIPRQRAVEEAAYALQESGFSITRSGLFEIYGAGQGFWFQERYAAAIRIRPGRTDIRVATLNGRATDTGAACRLALKIHALLQDKA